MKTLRSALLAAAALAALPALAQPPEDRRGRGGEAAVNPAPETSEPARFDRRGGFTPERMSPAPQPPREDAVHSFDGNRERSFDGRGRLGGERSRFDGNRGRFTDPDQVRPPVEEGRGRFVGNGDGRFDGRRFDGNRYDGDRYDGDRFDRRRYDYNDRFGNNSGRNFNRWNDGWRNDRRYDWQGWRDRNGSLFRGPRYVDPRGYGHGYRPFARGFRLDPLFFAPRFWLADPYDYRLPPAYGPYRWIRYYDDVLLVDIRSGIVVDVIRGFFW